MEPVRAFLDSNILFSAALGGPAFGLLWEIANADKVDLVTSHYCFLEAKENLDRKAPDALGRFHKLLESVSEVPESSAHRDWATALVPDKDAPVLAAAVGARAHVLITGDLKHFGELMGRNDLGLRIRTVRAFLLEGATQDG